MPIIVTVTAEDVNRSRRAVRAELAGWLRGARLLRRHGDHAGAAFIKEHAADFKAWAGARPIGRRQFDTRPRPGLDGVSRRG